LLVIASFSFTSAVPTELFPLSLHDALPICRLKNPFLRQPAGGIEYVSDSPVSPGDAAAEQRRCGYGPLRHGDDLGQRIGLQWVRSEEHTSELQSRVDLVCRLLLDKKNYDAS